MRWLLPLLLLTLVLAAPQQLYPLQPPPSQIFTPNPVLELTYTGPVTLIRGALYYEDALTDTYPASAFTDVSGNGSVYRIGLTDLVPGSYELAVEKRDAQPPYDLLPTDVISFTYYALSGSSNIRLVATTGMQALIWQTGRRAGFYQTPAFTAEFYTSVPTWCRYSDQGITDWAGMAPLTVTGAPGAPVRDHQLTDDAFDRDGRYYLRCRDATDEYATTFRLGYEDAPPAFTSVFDPPELVDPSDPRLNLTVNSAQALYCELLIDGQTHDTGGDYTREHYDGYRQDPSLVVTWTAIPNAATLPYTLTCTNRAGLTTQETGAITVDFTGDARLAFLAPNGFTNERAPSLAVQAQRLSIPVTSYQCAYLRGAVPPTSAAGATPMTSTDQYTYEAPLSGLTEGEHTYSATCWIADGVTVSGTHAFTYDATPPPPPLLEAPAYFCGAETLTATAAEDPVPDPDPHFTGYNWSLTRVGRTVPEASGTSTSGDLDSGVVGAEGVTYEWRVTSMDAAGNPSTPVTTRTDVVPQDDPNCDFTPPVNGHELLQTPGVEEKRIIVYCEDDRSGCEERFDCEWIPRGEDRACSVAGYQQCGWTSPVDGTPTPYDLPGGNGTLCYRISDVRGNTYESYAIVDSTYRAFDVYLEEPARLAASGGEPESGFSDHTPFQLVFRTTRNATCRYSYGGAGGFLSPWEANSPFDQSGRDYHVLDTWDGPRETPFYVGCREESGGSLTKTFLVGYEDQDPRFAATPSPALVVNPNDQNVELTVESTNTYYQDLYCEARHGTSTTNSGLDSNPVLTRTDAGAYEASPAMDLYFAQPLGAPSTVDVRVTCYNRAGRSTAQTVTVPFDFSSEGVLTMITPPAYTNERNPVRFQVRTLRQGYPVQMGACWFPNGNLQPLTGEQITYYSDLDLAEGAHTRSVTCQLYDGLRISNDFAFTVDRTPPDHYGIAAPSSVCGAQDLTAELSLPEQWTEDPHFAGYNYTITYADGGNVILDQGLVPGAARGATLTAGFTPQPERTYQWNVKPYDLAGNAPRGWLTARTLVRDPQSAECDATPPALDYDLREGEGHTNVTVSCEDDISGCTSRFDYSFADEDEACDYAATAYYTRTLRVVADTDLCVAAEDVRGNRVEERISIDVQELPDDPVDFCTNGVLDADLLETDVDCGGLCPACGLGDGCEQHEDCTSDYCSPGSVCDDPSCTDGILNGHETDVDCGGDCPTCDPGAGCDADSDCDAGYECADGACTEITVDPPDCQDDDDCSIGEYCNSQDECAPTTGSGCDDDDQCALYEACIGSTCVQITDPCNRDSQCYPDEVCEQGLCIPLFIPDEPEVGCYDYLDCSVGETCVDGVCGYHLEPVGDPSCSYDSDCPTGEKCNDGLCHAVIPPGSGEDCTYSTDCPIGETCDAGACRRSTPQCRDDLDCDPGEECGGGRCISEQSPSEPSGCYSDDDCLDGLECSAGACVEPSGPSLWGLITTILGLLIMGGSGYWLYVLHEGGAPGAAFGGPGPRTGPMPSMPARPAQPARPSLTPQQRAAQAAALQKRRALAAQRRQKNQAQRKSLLKSFDDAKPGASKPGTGAKTSTNASKTGQKPGAGTKTSASPSKPAQKPAAKPGTPSKSDAKPTTKPGTKPATAAKPVDKPGAKKSAFDDLDKIIDEHEKGGKSGK